VRIVADVQESPRQFDFETLLPAFYGETSLQAGGGISGDGMDPNIAGSCPGQSHYVVSFASWQFSWGDALRLAWALAPNCRAEKRSAFRRSLSRHNAPIQGPSNDRGGYAAGGNDRRAFPPYVSGISNSCGREAPGSRHHFRAHRSIHGDSTIALGLGRSGFPLCARLCRANSWRVTTADSSETRDIPKKSLTKITC
jgi:hypothetical protein